MAGEVAAATQGPVASGREVDFILSVTEHHRGLTLSALRVGRIPLGAVFKADCRGKGQSQEPTEKVTDVGGLTTGNREKWLDSGIILKVRLVGLADGLDKGYKGMRGSHVTPGHLAQATRRMELPSTKMGGSRLAGKVGSWAWWC